jgi:perosamine synthetase
MIPVNRPLIDDSDLVAVTNALKETYISGETPNTFEMEKLLCEIIKVKHAVAVSNGTVAIDLMIEALEIKKGDHCVVPNFTIISTVSNLLRKGARVEFIDADPETWSIDAISAVAAVNTKTKVILPVHIYGLPADMDSVMKVAKDNDVFVIEDSAEALGVKYKNRFCGSIANASTFSFYANKIVTGGEGGAITTNDDNLAKKLRSLRSLSHGPERFVHENLGWNARISGLSAALISSQLRRLDKLLIKKKEIASQYLEGLKDHPFLKFMPTKSQHSTNVYWVFPILLNANSPYNAVTLQEKLRNKGIETRRFFCPMHLQPVIKSYEVIFNSSYEISDDLWRNGLYLPCGLGTTRSEIDFTVETLWKLAQ